MSFLILSPNENRNANVFCAKFRLFVLIICIGCFFLQIFIEFSYVNFVCSIFAAVGSITSLFLLTSASIFFRAPLPAFAAFGCTVSIIFGSLVYQSFSLVPLASNLINPGRTFIFGAVFCVLITLSAHLSVNFIKFFGFESPLVVNALYKIGVYYWPDNKIIWIMAIPGVFSILFSINANASGGIPYGDALGKFIVALSFFAYFPYLIPIKIIAFGDKNKTNNLAIKLLAYTLLLIVIGFAKNSRSIFTVGIFNIFCAALIFSFMGKWLLIKSFLENNSIKILIFILLLPIFNALSDAMIVVRSIRSEIGIIEIVGQTIDVIIHGDAIVEHNLSNLDKINSGEYSEYYISNPYMSRFVLTKFLDNMISMDSIFYGDNKKILIEHTIDRVLYQFPTPALNLMGINLDKSLMEFSMGDYMFYVENSYGLGYYRVGSPVAHGFGIFGGYFFIFTIPIYVFYFSLINIFSPSVDGKKMFSPVVFALMMQIYTYASGDSLVDPINILSRNIPQAILMYLLVLMLLNFFLVKRR